MALINSLRRRWVKISIDVALFVGFITEFLTREGPDYALHSWVGIVLVPVIALHLGSNLGWIRRVVKRGRDDREFSLGVLNALLGALTVICVVTGFPLWLEWSEATALTTTHTVTGLLGIVLMFAHLFRNRSRIRQLLPKPASPAQPIT